MKKTSRKDVTRYLGRAASGAAFLVLLAGGCATQGAPVVGSETHFLTRCTASCGGGLDCIAGICTRGCLTESATCSELGATAVCTSASVEPGAVAVCDASCSGAMDCEPLGSGYACEAGYCRKGTPSADDGVGGGGCRPVGRYQAGKEGSYQPCCAGLNEIFTLQEGSDESGARVCSDTPVRNYACIEGACGDGLCEAPEAPCGCAADCPGTLQRLSSAECAPFLDQSAPPVVRGVTIVNTGSAPLYIQPYAPVCVGVTPALVQVFQIGPADDWVPLNIYGEGCGTTCAAVVENGWNAADGEGSLSNACPEIPCPPLETVALRPGESLFEASRLEVALQRLPSACADGIETNAINCYSRVIPQAALAYGISVYASASPDCALPGCQGQVFSRPVGAWFNEDLTIEVSAPAP